MATDRTALNREPGNRFLLLYALAYAGGFVAYVPLLTLLLPVKIALAAGEARIEWLGLATFAGAIAGSVANIAFGWASDLTWTRRGWATVGLALTLAAYALVATAETPYAIVAAVVAYQAALNMMLSALHAWAADVVPDHRKGLLGGYMGAGPPLGALAGVAVTWPGIPLGDAQLGVICALVVLMVVPLLVLGRAKAIAAPVAPPASGTALRQRDLALLWIARLLVQIAGSVLFAFLLYYFQSLPEAPSSADVARLTGLTLLAAMPLALLLGRASDRLDARRPFLFGAAMAMALGLAGLAGTPSLPLAIVAYALFGCGMAIFLALHAIYAMQLLPRPDRHGRDLGLFNLTNTLPALISPLLAIWLVPAGGFGTLMAVLAALTTIAGGFILLIREDAQST